MNDRHTLEFSCPAHGGDLYIRYDSAGLPVDAIVFIDADEAQEYADEHDCDAIH